MADRLAGGHLADELARLLAEGHSDERIAGLLYTAHGIETSRPTVTRWRKALGLERPDPEQAAS